MGATLKEIRALETQGASPFMAEIAALTTRAAKPKNLLEMQARDLVVPNPQITDVRDAVARAAATAAEAARAAGKSEAEVEAAGKPADIKLFLTETRARYEQRYRETRAAKEEGPGAAELSELDHRDINVALRYKYLAFVRVTPEPDATPYDIFCFYRGKTNGSEDLTDLNNFYPVPLECLDVFHASVDYRTYIKHGADVPMHTKPIGTEKPVDVSYPLYDPRFVVNKWRVTSSGKKFIAAVKELNEAAKARAPPAEADAGAKKRKRPSKKEKKEAPKEPSSSLSSSSLSSSDDSSSSGSSSSDSESGEDDKKAEPSSDKDKKKAKADTKSAQEDKAPPKKKARKEAAEAKDKGETAAAPAAAAAVDPKEAKRLAKNAREREKRQLKKAAALAAAGKGAAEPPAAPAAPAPAPAEAPVPAAPLAPRAPEYGVPADVAAARYGVQPLTATETTTNCLWTDLVDKTGHRFAPSVHEVHQLMVSAAKAAGQPLADASAGDKWTASAYVRFLLTTLAPPNPVAAMQPWIDQAARGATDAPALGSFELERVPQALGKDIFERMLQQVFLTANAATGLRFVAKRNAEAGAKEY